MQINSISMAMNKNVGFKSSEQEQPKPFIQITPDMPDSQIVHYSNYGGNYVVPVTAGDIRKMQAEKAYAETAKPTIDVLKETPEEYYARKINSVEWML